MSFLRDATIIFSIIALCVWVTTPYVPWFDDEFIVYRGLACALRPHFILPSENCSYSLKLWGWLGYMGYLPLRSYLYVGWPQGIFFWPVAALTPHLQLARIFSLSALALQSIIAARAFGVNRILLFLILLLFAPWSFQHLVDTGQLWAQLPFALLALVWGRSWFATQRNREPTVFNSLLIGLLLTVGVWAKLSFIFVLPGLFLYFILGGRDWICREKNTIVWLKRLSVLSLAFALPTAALLFAKEGRGSYYFSVISGNSSINYIFSLESQITNFLEKFGHLFLFPASTAEVVKSFEGHYWSYSSISYLLLLLSFAHCFVTTDKMHRYRGSIAFVCGVLTLCVVNASPRSWAMHHIVYSFPFFLFAGLEFYTGVIPRAWARRFLISALLSFAPVWGEIIGLDDNHHERDRPIQQVLDTTNNIAKKSSVIFALDWGACFALQTFINHSIEVNCLSKRAFLFRSRELADLNSLGVHMILVTPRLTEEEQKNIFSIFRTAEYVTSKRWTGLWQIIEVPKPQPTMSMGYF
jgi:hypothetical protein